MSVCGTRRSYTQKPATQLLDRREEWMEQLLETFWTENRYEASMIIIAGKLSIFSKVKPAESLIAEKVN